jgi:DNA end-binding protein Ku
VPDQITDSEVRARAFWSGTITFGLVSIPVNLFPANRSGGVSFRMVDEDGTPLARQ